LVPVTSASDVIEAFRSGPPGYGQAYPLLFGLAEERRGELPVLARQVLEELPASSKLTRAVLPWLDRDDLVTLADPAVAVRGRPGRPRRGRRRRRRRQFAASSRADQAPTPPVGLDEGAYFL
jgi:hypothetical protein